VATRPTQIRKCRRNRRIRRKLSLKRRRRRQNQRGRPEPLKRSRRRQNRSERYWKVRTAKVMKFYIRTCSFADVFILSFSVWFLWKVKVKTWKVDERTFSRLLRGMDDGCLPRAIRRIRGFRCYIPTAGRIALGVCVQGKFSTVRLRVPKPKKKTKKLGLHRTHISALVGRRSNLFYQ